MRNSVAIPVGFAVLAGTLTLDGADCNANGYPDEVDISRGASEDADGSGVPDECENTVRLLVVGPSEMTIVVTHVTPLFGFRLELGYESRVGQPQDRAGKDYGIGTAGYVYVGEPMCPGGPDGFLSITWETYEPNGLPPGEHATIGLGFPGLVDGDCTRAEIICSRVELRGSDGKLLRNQVIQDAVEVCQFEAEVFRRGDADGGFGVTISDAIAILSFLFVGDVAIDCLDAADSSDQGQVDISSALGILHWLFGSGSPPSYPGPSQCGVDATPDLLDCASFPTCATR